MPRYVYDLTKASYIVLVYLAYLINNLLIKVRQKILRRIGKGHAARGSG